MTEAFLNYENEFCKEQNQINKILLLLPNQSNGQLSSNSDKKESGINDLKIMFNETENILKFMELESLNSNEFESKFKAHKRDFESSKRSFYKIQENYAEQKTKDTLMGSKLDEESQNLHNQRLLKNGQMLSNQNQKLQEAIQSSYDAEGTAIEIQKELARNSETLKGSIKKTSSINEEFSFANRIINRIQKRMMTNRMIFLGTLGIILILIVVLVYFAFFK